MHAGGIDSSGFALGPLLWQVHTRDVSWAMTTGNPDMWDCYEVETDPSNPGRFLFDGEWRQMEVREETFQVLDGEPVTRTFSYTRHNGVLSPVVGRDGNRAYVVSISQMHDTGILDDEIYRMNHARSVPELFEAMKSLGMFPQNLVLGDSSGNISYLRAGKTPVRPAGFDWTRPVPGNSSKTAWRGYYPLEDMVQVHNPPQGYIQNNNVAPDRLFADGNLDASSYPKGLFHDTPGRITTRGLRAVRVLSKAESFTVASATDLAFDERWITAQDWVRALRSVTDRFPELMEGRSELTRVFIDSLLAFDGDAAADSVAALRFYYWRRGMWEVFKRPEFESLRHLPWPATAFSRQFGDALIDRAQAAAREMVAELGRIDVPLGEVFRVGRGEASWPLGGESINLVEVPGCIAHVSPLCERTMRAFASGPMDDHHQRRAYRGSHSMRLVVFSDPIQSYSLKVYGQSDDPRSPHYDDQARLASERRFKPTFFEWSELEGNIESSTVLHVEGESQR
jgi:acyl-homoserine lactone acylase PvdQ